MAVVKKKSDLYRDEAAGEAVLDAARAKGRLRVAQGVVSNAAGEESGSTYLICEVPAGGIPDVSTFFDVENDGFAQIVIGTLTDTDALVDQTRATANVVSPFASGDANHAKAWWEVLGLAENPGGFIRLYKHAEATATGAGSMPFRVAWFE